MSAAFGTIGVLGAGHLGRIHIQQLLELSDWQLAGFHDPDPKKVEAIQQEFGVQAFASVDELIEACATVDVVTPTLSHFDLASAALRRGRHVFIEKPLTETPDEARELLALRGKDGPRVQVGHVERFNPAFVAAAPHLKDPMFIETHRLAQFNPRGTDVSVVLDLMIHDLDMVLHVVPSEVARISASGVAVVSDTPDIANARIEFANGCVANLTASRISLKNMRKSRFFQRDAYIAVDMLERSAEIVRMGPALEEPDPFAISIDLGQGRGHRAISFEKPEVLASNAIREELRAFGRSVASGTAPEVSLEDGLRALETAHLVLQQVEQRH